MRETLRRVLTVCLILINLGIGLRQARGDEPAADARKKDIARWNDRSTPRKTLETLFFSILCYDLSPELIVNAIDCLDLSDFGPDETERDAALMAHELNGILSRQDIALYGVPDLSGTERTYTVAQSDGIKIVLERQSDGKWRFDKETIRSIPKMRGLSYRNQRTLQAERMKLAAGRTDPEATIRSFIADLARHDYTSAARCLDLQDIPPKLRSVKGPELARKLAFVVQRCGFVFPQEFPSDPDGWRYIWHSNHRGRIMLDRVRMADDKDAWLFSRNTLRNLDALVEGFKNVPPDPRYVRVGVLVEASALTDQTLESVNPPAGVPIALGSARATLRTFSDAMDALEYDDRQGQVLLSCLDLRGIPESERGPLGLRLAGKLDAILRHNNVDLLGVSDSWEGEPQVIGSEVDRQVSLVRQPDGAWRFSQETVARIPELFNQLTVQEKSDRDRRSQFSSARQTVRTLISSVDRGDLAAAAECLDLQAIPAGARDDLGPVLAVKLRFVLDQLGHVVIQEVPNETDGPRFYCYRGPSGRISLAQKTVDSRITDWLFTSETVAKIDSMFNAALEKSKLAPNPRREVLGELTGLWITSHLPTWTRTRMMGLCLYQWVGLGTILTLSGLLGWFALRLIGHLTPRILHIAKLAIGAEFVAEKIQPLGFLLALWSFYVLLRWLDLPISVVSSTLPTIKFLWVVLLAWMAVRMIDLAMAVYINSEHLNIKRNLSDMIVPTAARCCKLLVVILAVSYQVYLLGNGESLRQLLAGLGLAGLAASLAAQDTIKSVFGTLLLIAERPFKIGDVIVVNGLEGTVETVGFRSTRLRTFEDSLATIPNSVIAGASIDNRGVRIYRRYREFISLTYDTPLDRLITLRDSLRSWASEHPRINKERIDIHLNRLAGSSIDLLINVYFRAATFTEEQTCRDELNRSILAFADEQGVSIAFPTQTIQIAHQAEPEGAIPAPKFSNRHHVGETASAKLRVDSPEIH